MGVIGLHLCLTRCVIVSCPCHLMSYESQANRFKCVTSCFKMKRVSFSLRSVSLGSRSFQFVAFNSTSVSLAPIQFHPVSCSVPYPFLFRARFVPWRNRSVSGWVQRFRWGSDMFHRMFQESTD